MPAAVSPDRPIARGAQPPLAAARRPLAAAASRPAQAPAVPAITRDRRLVVGRPAERPQPATPPKAGFKAPGEDLRNGVSVINMVLGPLVTAGQAVGMLAKATFANPLIDALAHTAVNLAERVGHMPFLQQPLMRSGFHTAARILPFISAGLLCFDAYAAWHTLRNPQASGLRKGLTVARFGCNAVACAMTFVPGAGFVYSLVPALVGNVFEFAVMRMNAKNER